MTTLVKIPATFASDRSDRELPMGNIVSRNKRHWVCEMDADTLADLEDDARYYRDMYDMGDMREYRSECESARRTLAAIAKATA